MNCLAGLSYIKKNGTPMKGSHIYVQNFFPYRFTTLRAILFPCSSVIISW